MILELASDDAVIPQSFRPLQNDDGHGCSWETVDEVSEIRNSSHLASHRQPAPAAGGSKLHSSSSFCHFGMRWILRFSSRGQGLSGCERGVVPGRTADGKSVMVKGQRQ